MSVMASIPILFAVEDSGGLDEWLLPDTAELVWGLVAFALLMAFLYWKVFPALGRTLDQRREKIQDQIEEAEAARAEGERLRRQYEEQLADARAQANTIIDEARAQAERLRSEELARAQAEAQQILARAREDAEADRGRLVQELRSQVATLSVELAGRIVQRELDPDRHRELVDQYINELSGMN
jgi:F-type H+-transporting ATPase subunit b